MPCLGLFKFIVSVVVKWILKYKSSKSFALQWISNKFWWINHDIIYNFTNVCTGVLFSNIHPMNDHLLLWKISLNSNDGHQFYNINKYLISNEPTEYKKDHNTWHWKSRSWFVYFVHRIRFFKMDKISHYLL